MFVLVPSKTNMHYIVKKKNDNDEIEFKLDLLER